MIRRFFRKSPDRYWYDDTDMMNEIGEEEFNEVKDWCKDIATQVILEILDVILRIITKILLTSLSPTLKIQYG